MTQQVQPSDEVLTYGWLKKHDAAIEELRAETVSLHTLVIGAVAVAAIALLLILRKDRTRA